MPTDTAPIPSSAESCAAINRLLHHEQGAVETYQRVIDAVPVQVGHGLRPILDDHQRRIGILNECLQALHGCPDPQPPLPSSVLSGLPTGPGAGLDPLLVVGALAEMEGRGVADYRRELACLDDASRLQVEAVLLPAQERAVASLATLSSNAQPDQPSGPQA